MARSSGELAPISMPSFCQGLIFKRSAGKASHCHSERGYPECACACMRVCVHVCVWMFQCTRHPLPAPCSQGRSWSHGVLLRVVCEHVDGTGLGQFTREDERSVIDPNAERTRLCYQIRSRSFVCHDRMWLFTLCQSQVHTIPQLGRIPDAAVISLSFIGNSFFTGTEYDSIQMPPQKNSAYDELNGNGLQE